MKHSFYFYTTFSLLIILGLIISGYIFGWTVPSANPPSGNLSAPINTGSTNQAKTGYLAVGTSTTPTYPLEVGNQLRVWGQLISKVASGTAPFVIYSPTKITNLNADLLDGYDSADLLAGAQTEVPVQAATYFSIGGNPYYCKKLVIDTTGYVTTTNVNNNYICDTDKICQNGACVAAGGSGTFCDDDGDGHTSSYLVANCTNKKYIPGDDCDDSCSTCYSGSVAYTTSPDGKDQDCDGSIDDFKPTYIYVYMSTSSYTGNLGGRAGADAKCDLGTTLDCDSGRNRAFLSVSSNDEIRDMPSNYGYSTNKPIYWYNRSNGSTLILANNWADMLDGSIINSQYAGTGLPYYGWTGSTSDGAAGTYNCLGWRDSSSSQGGFYGLGSGTDARWMNNSNMVIVCNQSARVRCICENSFLKYR